MPTIKDDVRPAWAKATTTTNKRRLIWACVGISAFFGLTALLHTQHAGDALSRHLECATTATASSSKTQLAGSESVAPTKDTFASYNGRSECGVSSLDVFTPTNPLCSDRSTLLSALSGGGRLGVDAPYVPRGCDMRWYTAADACKVLSRFSNIMIVGDSLMRHLTIGLYSILRQDLVAGGLREWDFGGYAKDMHVNVDRCRCESGFGPHCYPLLIWDSDWLAGNRSKSWTQTCGAAGAGRITYHELLKHPLRRDHLDKFTSTFPVRKPDKPVAIVLGQGMHSFINTTATKLFFEQLGSEIAASRPWVWKELTKLEADGWQPDNYTLLQRLYISPSSGSYKKTSNWLEMGQSTNAIGKFEIDMRPWVEGKGWEFLGTWNMSVQTSSPDGTHGNIQTDLLSAQMVLNWLDNLAVESWGE